MIEYFITFAVVIVLTVIAQYSYKKNKALSYMCSFASICILSLISALRRFDVGVDVKIYGIDFFDSCRYFSKMKNYIAFYENEQLYFALNYIVFYLTRNIRVLFFIMQFFIALVVYVIAYDNMKKNDTNILLYVIAYLFLWFNSSLNILRQSLAIFIILYAFKFIEKKKYFAYFIAIFIASLFHSSAIICVLIPLIDYIAQKKNWKIYLFFSIVIVYTILFNINTVAVLLNKINIVPDKYLMYLSRNGNMITYYALLKVIMLLAITVFFRKSENKEINRTLFCICVYDVVFYTFSYFIKYGYRISYYFLPHMLLLLPRMEVDLKNSKGKNTFWFVSIISLVVYWFVRYTIVKYDGTIPYNFYWEV